MIDREKVIKGLRCCTSFDSVDQTCMACPFENDCVEKQRNTQLLNDALALLKETEPVEPTLRHGGDGIFVWACGSCGAYMYHINGIDKAKEYAKYCRQCGRMVKWDE